MFSIVYVLLPFSDRSPAEAIRASLAPFERGRRGDVPDDWLTFHEETAHVRSLHETNFIFTREDGGGIRIEGGDVTYLDFEAVEAAMAELDLRRWTVRFANIEPDISSFVARFVRDLERHPVSGGYGVWLNPLGRWDWWDLGGRFDGRITGEQRRAGRTASVVSSGASRGREVLTRVGDMVSRALDDAPAAEVVVEADTNVEMVSRLLEDALAGFDHTIPGAVLLPPGSVEDGMRWLRSWPEVEPEATLQWLGLSSEADWKATVIAAYGRFPDHWAAGVAYHL